MLRMKTGRLARTVFALAVMGAFAMFSLIGCNSEGVMEDNPTADLSGKESMELAEEEAVPVDELGQAYMNVAHGAFIVADDKVCTIRCTDKGALEEYVGYFFTIKNNYGGPIMVHAGYEKDVWLVNGKAANPILDEVLEPGETVEAFLQFSLHDIESLDALANVDGTILVEDDSTREVLAEYEVKLA